MTHNIPELVAMASPPTLQGKDGLQALQTLVKHRNILNVLEVMHHQLGDVFRVWLPGFRPVFMAGPEATRFVLITARDKLLWRPPEGDPVTDLLRHGLLVEDGQAHDRLRRLMTPSLHRRMLIGYVEKMIACTDQVANVWPEDKSLDMLVEMRRIALLILMQTLFKVDFSADMTRLWDTILRLLAYISPGAWIVFPGIPRPGYKNAVKQMDDYLYQLIHLRRTAGEQEADDLLGILVSTPDLSDALIRDQLLTMLIAGHDTSTALLAWTLYLLGSHPAAMTRAQDEVDAVLGRNSPTFEAMKQLKYLDLVVKESLRLYPPIHLGTRVAAGDLTFQGYHIPAGTRVLYSIYLTHRDPKYWPNPAQFNPERFGPEQSRTRPAFTYIPFGGGARNCIGAAFGLMEAKVVLARLLQKFNLRLTNRQVHPHMGATLEPRPGVMMQAKRRSE